MTLSPMKILFASTSPELLPVARLKLDAVATAFRSQSDRRISLAAEESALARRIRDYLVSRGVRPTCISGSPGGANDCRIEIFIRQADQPGIPTAVLGDEACGQPGSLAVASCPTGAMEPSLQQG
jgi:hypothetical protein